MAELNNLDQITDKIYLEGIEKAERESRSILLKTQQEREQLLSDAKRQADEIITQAQREAERMARRVEKELQLKGKQFISDLQHEVQYLLNEKIVEKGVKGAFADEDFTKSIIMEAVKSWKEGKGLELILPAEMEGKLKAAFANSIEQHSKNLIITFNRKITGGFRIGVKDGTYQVSFTEQDFIQLFQPYLTSQAQKLLFSEK